MRLGREIVGAFIFVLKIHIAIVRKITGIAKAVIMVAASVDSAMVSISQASHLNQVALQVIRLKLAGPPAKGADSAWLSANTVVRRASPVRAPSPNLTIMRLGSCVIIGGFLNHPPTLNSPAKTFSTSPSKACHARLGDAQAHPRNR